MYPMPGICELCSFAFSQFTYGTFPQLFSVLTAIILFCFLLLVVLLNALVKQELHLCFVNTVKN